jgi:Sigma-70 factor, region 1.1
VARRLRLQRSPYNGCHNGKHVRLYRRRRPQDDQGGEETGYVTHDQVNAVLSSSDQIEDFFVTLSEMCINVVQNKEAKTEEGDDGKDD